MADRYQDDDYQQAPRKSDNDPLAELARLIGQTDPFANMGGRANQPMPPRPRFPDPAPEPAYEADEAPLSLSASMTR